MHKLTRITAAVLLSLSMASTGMLTAYADETTTTQADPGYTAPEVPAPGAPVSDPAQTAQPQADAQLPQAPADTAADAQVPTDTAADTQLPQVPTDTAADTQLPQTDPAGQIAETLPQTPAVQPSAYPPPVFNSDEEAYQRAVVKTVEFGETIPYIAGSVCKIDQHWQPTFITDDTMHNHGNGWYSMQMIIRNELGNLFYRTYSSTTGWSSWAMNGEETTHLTDGSAVEAVQVRMAGVITNEYDIYYRATLSDGTELDWAKNGQTSGSMGNGKWMIAFRMMLHPKATVFPYSTTKTMDTLTGTDGIQFHANALPTYTDGAGVPYSGWAWDNNQRYYFLNDQAATGWQYIDGYKYYFDETNGKLISDLRDMLGYVGPYMLKINRVTDTLTVYAQDGANGYILPIVSFLTTTGDDTPYGTFKIPEKYRWRLMYGDVYTQYAMRLKDGFMVHSVIFNRQNPYTLDTITYNNLGIGRSHGCTRLKTGEVKWIYDNCPVGTTVQIYDSPINGPFEPPVLDALIPADMTFDPTDPTVPEAVAYSAAVQAQKQAQEQAQAEAEASSKAQREAEEQFLGGSGSITVDAGTQPVQDVQSIAQPGEPIA